MRSACDIEWGWCDGGGGGQTVVGGVGSVVSVVEEMTDVAGSAGAELTLVPGLSAGGGSLCGCPALVGGGVSTVVVVAGGFDAGVVGSSAGGGGPAIGPNARPSVVVVVGPG